jgi:FixJ family two-component response regulator
VVAGTKPGYSIGRDESGLTQREKDVLAGMVQGQNGQQIGHALGISKQRVDQIQKSLVLKGRLQKEEHRYVVVVPRG